MRAHGVSPYQLLHGRPVRADGILSSRYNLRDDRESIRRCPGHHRAVLSLLDLHAWPREGCCVRLHVSVLSSSGWFFSPEGWATGHTRGLNTAGVVIRMGSRPTVPGAYTKRCTHRAKKARQTSIAVSPNRSGTTPSTRASPPDRDALPRTRFPPHRLGQSPGARCLDCGGPTALTTWDRRKVLPPEPTRRDPAPGDDPRQAEDVQGRAAGGQAAQALPREVVRRSLPRRSLLDAVPQHVDRLGELPRHRGTPASGSAW